MEVRLSFRNDVRQPDKFNGLYALPDGRGFRLVRDVFGDPAKFDTANEAEAAAGHVLCKELEKVQVRK